MNQFQANHAESNFRHVERALGWALAGLLLTHVLINAIGLISPFWGALLHPDEPRVSMDLLEAWQPVTPWFSICFAVAGWHLAGAARSAVARVGIVALFALVPVAIIGASFARRAIEQAGTPIPPQGPALFNMVGGMYAGFAAIAFIALAWLAIRRTNRSAGATL